MTNPQETEIEMLREMWSCYSESNDRLCIAEVRGIEHVHCRADEAQVDYHR